MIFVVERQLDLATVSGPWSLEVNLCAPSARSLAPTLLSSPAEASAPPAHPGHCLLALLRATSRSPFAMHYVDDSWWALWGDWYFGALRNAEWPNGRKQLCHSHRPLTKNAPYLRSHQTEKPATTCLDTRRIRSQPADSKGDRPCRWGWACNVKVWRELQQISCRERVGCSKEPWWRAKPFAKCLAVTHARRCCRPPTKSFRSQSSADQV